VVQIGSQTDAHAMTSGCWAAERPVAGIEGILRETAGNFTPGAHAHFAEPKKAPKASTGVWLSALTADQKDSEAFS
jgi:hypothetical protein